MVVIISKWNVSVICHRQRESRRRLPNVRLPWTFKLHLYKCRTPAGLGIYLFLGLGADNSGSPMQNPSRHRTVCLFVLSPRVEVDLNVHEPLWTIVKPPWQTGTQRPFFIWPNPTDIRQLVSTHRTTGLHIERVLRPTGVWQKEACKGCYEPSPHFPRPIFSQDAEHRWRRGSPFAAAPRWRALSHKRGRTRANYIYICIYIHICIERERERYSYADRRPPGQALDWLNNTLP